MNMKEQYHTFESENRKAEVFFVGSKTPGQNWLIECYEDDAETHKHFLATELFAELYADNWVLKVINNENTGTN